MPQQQRVTAPGPAASPSAEEIADMLAVLPLFARVDRDAQVAVAERCTITAYRAGDTLMRQDESGGFACVLIDGEIDIFVEIPAGRIHIATVPRHHIVGELAVLTGTPRTATVVARTDVLALRIKRDALVRLTAKYPSLASTIVRELGGRQHSMNRSLAYLTYAANALGRDEYDAAMLAELTSQPGAFAGFARAFANMADEIRAKQQRRQELQAAAAIQESILPPPLPRGGATSAIDLHAEMHPAREIGGDFYDFFLLGEDHLALTIADVSGKGIPAALFMAVSRTVLRSITGIDDMPARMAEANRLLSADNTASMFVTMFHGVVDLATGILRYCNAGHNPPYLLRAGQGREMLKPTGAAFGLDADMPYRIDETVLQPGDALFLFTDGITECFDRKGEEFGNARLEAALEAGRGRAAAELVAGILQATEAFAAGAEQSDDITCLALRFRP
jgi:sigma-B regulation protein RsbU (phosphoserine phosphatase)